MKIEKTNNDDFGLPDLKPVELARSLLEFKKTCYLHTVDISKKVRLICNLIIKPLTYSFDKEYPTTSKIVPYILVNDLYPATPILSIKKDSEQHFQILNGETVSVEIYPYTHSTYDPVNIDLPRISIIGTPIPVEKNNEIEQILTRFSMYIIIH